MKPWVTDVSLFLAQAQAAGQADPVRRGPGHHPRHRSRHLPVRHLVELDGGRRLHGPGDRAASDRQRAGRGEGLHDTRRRRAAADGVVRPDGGPAARGRPGVRGVHRAAAAVRVVRRRRRPLRGARQRARLDRPHQDGRARRPAVHRRLHRLPVRRPDAHGVPRRPAAAGRLPADLRAAARLVEADARCAVLRRPAGGGAVVHRPAGGTHRRPGGDHLDGLGSRRDDLQGRLRCGLVVRPAGRSGRLPVSVPGGP